MSPCSARTPLSSVVTALTFVTYGGTVISLRRPLQLNFVLVCNQKSSVKVLENFINFVRRSPTQYHEVSVIFERMRDSTRLFIIKLVSFNRLSIHIAPVLDS